MTRTLAASLAALLPLAGAALDWSGRVGFEYVRDDQWSGSGERSTYPRLDLNLALDARGFAYRPDVITYGASVNYRRLTMETPGSRSENDELRYRADLRIFPGARSPLTLDLNASRANEGSDHGSSSGALETLMTQWGASLRINLPGRPNVYAGYQRLDVERTGAIVAPTESRIQTVTGRVTEGTGIFSYNAAYRGNFSEGTYATNNYDDHRVDLSGKVFLTPDWRVTVSDSYYLREATTQAATNPSQEFTVFSAALHNKIDARDTQQLQYRYTHGLQEAAGLTRLDRAAQSATYSLRRTLDREWRIAGLASVNQTQIRLGASDESSTGESIGAIAYWRRERTPDLKRVFELRGGPTIGAVQPYGADSRLGFGVTAGGTYEWLVAPTTIRVAYDVNFQNDIGEEGSRLTQSALASASRPIRSGLLTGTLHAAAHRADGPLLGVRANRSVNASGEYKWGGYAAGIQVALSDSVNPSLDEDFAGDGLVVAPYDQHSRLVALTGRAALARRARLTGQFRLTSTEIPDRPSTLTTEARAGIEFDYGAFRFALEERFLTAESDGSVSRANEVFVRIFRAFGSGT